MSWAVESMDNWSQQKTGCRGGFLFGQTETIFLNVEVYIHNCTVTIYTSTDMNCVYIYISLRQYNIY